MREFASDDAVRLQARSMTPDAMTPDAMTTDATVTGAPRLDAASLEHASAFVEGAGLVVDEITGSKVTGHIRLGAAHHTPWGIVHGGVYATAIESAASIGACTAVAPRPYHRPMLLRQRCNRGAM